MKIYCINLDRHPQRMQRMRESLSSVTFERIAAVDGANCPGPERRDITIPATADTLTRFERACLASHRLAWTRLLQDDAPCACVLEDDVVLSPEFSAFMQDASWIPANCSVVKLETVFELVMLSRATRPAHGRQLAEIRSPHYGSAGYVLNRLAAEQLLAATANPERTVDDLLFHPSYSQAHGPTWQLIPALCAQANCVSGAITFEELQSSIQTPPSKKMKSKFQRFNTEVGRPFRQLAEVADRCWFQWRTRSERRVVPLV